MKIIRFFLFVFICVILTGCGTMLPVKPPANQPPAVPLKHKPRIALVLGSGGARGYAHLGVLQALEEAGIKADLLAGCSAGAVVAGLYADNQSAIATKNILMNAGFWDFAELSNIGLFGMIKGSSFEYFLLKHMHARNFADLHTKLLVVTTDLRNGMAYTIQAGPLAPSLLASSAIPGVISPVAMYDRFLIDGGVVDPVPVDLVKPFHPKMVIAVDLSRVKVDAGLPRTAFGVSSSAYDIMRRHITDESEHGADVVITPECVDDTFVTSRRQEIFLAGLEAGRRAVPEIKRIMRLKGIRLSG
jgi:NTE family protein